MEGRHNRQQSEETGKDWGTAGGPASQTAGKRKRREEDPLAAPPNDPTIAELRSNPLSVPNDGVLSCGKQSSGCNEPVLMDRLSDCQGLLLHYMPLLSSAAMKLGRPQDETWGSARSHVANTKLCYALIAHWPFSPLLPSVAGPTINLHVVVGCNCPQHGRSAFLSSSVF